MEKRKYTGILLALFFCLSVRGQVAENDSSVQDSGLGQMQETWSDAGKLAPYIQALDAFSKRIPQEKVYLHFDNTSYYQGDPIWFKCYVVAPGHLQTSRLSKTLYVELLNPGGETVDKRILKIENGQCHGEFILNQIPFYSGFYEIRAYTKYMLNFGDDVIFSRLLPVFDKPKAEGNFEEKKMLGYGRYGPAGNYAMKREPPIRENRVNLRFFPEGGTPVQGIKSRIAFEATDAAGNPIDVSGQIPDGNRQEICPIVTLHEGKGVFTYTPGIDGRRRDIAEVEYDGRKYRFDLPPSRPQGVVMEVDNLSSPDSIGITLRKNVATPSELLGVTVSSGGKLQNYVLIRPEEEETYFQMDRTRLPAGVSQIVLFDGNGEILCDRLIFIDRPDLLEIKAKTDKPSYAPFERVDMEITLTDQDANPVPAPFSVSVRDGANEVDHTRSILTDLLLMSEIKGFVRNPSYYFEATGTTRQDVSLHLDVLLMVQGWRRYAWKQMAGIEKFELKHFPEQGIETEGQVLAFPLIGKPSPKPGVDIDLVLYELGSEDEQGAGAVTSFVTDGDGRFRFVSDVEGKWSMLLSATEKGKAKNYQIVLDRLFSPAPRRYRYAELQVDMTGNNLRQAAVDEEAPADSLDEDYDTFLAALTDSLSKLSKNEKILHLDEVTVTAKNTKEQEIYRNRSTSTAYYDMASEMEDIYDRGQFFIGNDINELLRNMDENFMIMRRGNYEFMLYKGKMPLFVIDYNPVDLMKPMWSSLYKQISPTAIKSIYIKENTFHICHYAILPPGINCLDFLKVFNCIVFIETYPDGEVPVSAGKGIRKTRLEGYSQVKEFYSPDYSGLPPEPDDYRRTLYWNPMVIPDENGKARIPFYNNSRSTNFSINAETVTPDGKIGVLK
ncbi:MAG: hypothetical protein LBE56_09065 [Tannerella sp.]|nr:hypothetical protein [Tannerella sp.]